MGAVTLAFQLPIRWYDEQQKFLLRFPDLHGRAMWKRHHRQLCFLCGRWEKLQAHQARQTHGKLDDRSLESLSDLPIWLLARNAPMLVKHVTVPLENTAHVMSVLSNRQKVVLDRAKSELKATTQQW